MVPLFTVLVHKQGMNLDTLYFKDTLFNHLLIINNQQVWNPTFEIKMHILTICSVFPSDSDS